MDNEQRIHSQGQSKATLSQLGTDHNGNSQANTRLVLEMGKLPKTRGGYKFPGEDFIRGYHLQFSAKLPNLPHSTISINTGQNKLRFF